jgi:hypothetical protein
MLRQPAQVKGLGQVRAGIGIGAEPDLGTAQVAVGLGLPRMVVKIPRGGQCGLLGRRQILPVPSPVERMSSRSRAAARRAR